MGDMGQFFVVLQIAGKLQSIENKSSFKDENVPAYSALQTTDE